MQYYLSLHVFACIANERFVFLNLRDDSYSSIERAKTAAIAGVLHGSSSNVQPVDSQATVTNDDVTGELQALIDARILVRRPNDGKRWESPSIPVPTRRLIENGEFKEVRVRVIDICRFFGACAAASWELRWATLEASVRKLSRRKARVRKNGSKFDFKRARVLVSKFEKLRPLFPRNYLCLFDSLALMKFLASYRIYPAWVYGVRVEPFGAHCWVQEDDRTFNEAFEVAAAYTPIMTV